MDFYLTSSYLSYILVYSPLSFLMRSDLMIWKTNSVYPDSFLINALRSDLMIKQPNLYIPDISLISVPRFDFQIMLSQLIQCCENFYLYFPLIF